MVYLLFMLHRFILLPSPVGVKGGERAVYDEKRISILNSFHDSHAFHSFRHIWKWLHHKNMVDQLGLWCGYHCLWIWLWLLLEICQGMFTFVYKLLHGNLQFWSHIWHMTNTNESYMWYIIEILYIPEMQKQHKHDFNVINTDKHT